MRNDFRYLHTMLDGLLSTTKNGLGIIALYVLAMGAELPLNRVNWVLKMRFKIFRDAG